ncbi:MAG: hypothetical protein QM767_11350 [Anaeromyxobacter sp.]
MASANAINISHTARPEEKKAAKSRYLQGLDQMNLLKQGTNNLSSDFYTYRYLATEGFLPGYNFPRLPLMAYVPASTDGSGGKQTFLQRPRFLALSEFGPRSLVYHEGRAYRVVRALLSLSGLDATTPNAELPTKSVRICRSCGAGHFTPERSTCHGCGVSLGDAELVNHVFRIENVATQQAERITANDEERQRQGFELQTTFQWAERDGDVDVRKGVAADSDGEILRIGYGPGATITRVNKGLRRRANKKQLGFRIDPVSGYWAKNEDEDDENRQSDQGGTPVDRSERGGSQERASRPAGRGRPRRGYAHHPAARLPARHRGRLPAGGGRNHGRGPCRPRTTGTASSSMKPPRAAPAC